MKIDAISSEIFLAQTAELGLLFFWIYDHNSGQWDISSSISIFFGDHRSDLTDQDKQNYFFRYINLIQVEERKKIEDLISGNVIENEGTYIYSLNFNDKVYYHKCRFTQVEYEGHKRILGTVSLNFDTINAKIIETIPDFIFIFDRNFFLRDILKSKSIKLLHPVDQLIDADGRSIYSSEVTQQYLTAIQQCLDQQTLIEIEYPLEVENDKYYFQARMVPFEKDRVLALIHDITEKIERTQELVQAKRKAEEADHMKSAFLANMSHEIRTPLNAIVGFSELLTVTEDPVEKKEYTEIIQTNSLLLLQLINDILDLSRIESGKTEISLQATNLNVLLEGVRQIHELKMNSGVKLFLQLPVEQIWLETDPNRITQVLFNFMSNAIKNTSNGSITLALTKEEGEVCLSVSDTGCGIPKDKLEVIFERFIKINDFVQGTGLGLSICRTIADKLNGRIDVQSEYGKGSTFSFYLPLLASAQ